MYSSKLTHTPKILLLRCCSKQACWNHSANSFLLPSLFQLPIRLLFFLQPCFTEDWSCFLVCVCVRACVSVKGIFFWGAQRSDLSLSLSLSLSRVVSICLMHWVWMLVLEAWGCRQSLLRGIYFYTSWVAAHQRSEIRFCRCSGLLLVSRRIWSWWWGFQSIWVFLLASESREVSVLRFNSIIIRC